MAGATLSFLMTQSAVGHYLKSGIFRVFVAYSWNRCDQTGAKILDPITGLFSDPKITGSRESRPASTSLRLLVYNGVGRHRFSSYLCGANSRSATGPVSSFLFVSPASSGRPSSRYSLYENFFLSQPPTRKRGRIRGRKPEKIQQFCGRLLVHRVPRNNGP